MPSQKRNRDESSGRRGARGAESRIFDAYTKIRTSEVRISKPNGEVRKLPESLHAFLAQLAQDLETGKPVTIFEENADLSTAEAAGMLAVSRQFLVNLLEEGLIPFHMVGTHRRVYARDVQSFKTKRDQIRRKTIDDLVRAEMRDGLYDRVPLNESRAK